MARKSAKRSNQQKKTAEERMNIPAKEQEYRGGIMIPRSHLQEDQTLANVQYNGAKTSTGAGLMNDVWGLDLSLFNNYTNYTNSYDEWRCLGAELIYIPDYESAQIPLTTTTNALGGAQVGVVDRDSSGALTSYNAWEYGSAELAAINKPMKLIFKMSGSEDAQFINSTSASPAYFKFYASGLSGSFSYGTVFVKALFQFRGRY
jgi:hypothetical protein